MFKVGDKVAFKTNLIQDKRYGGIHFINGMQDVKKKYPIVTIKNTLGDNIVYLKECQFNFGYSVDMFIPADSDTLFDKLINNSITEEEYKRYAT
jgi:hypothetical protein